jgi:acetyl-CoA carboxylase biotin carboxylase subunit
MAHQDVLKKVLIANRGEIAVRVIRACRELGIRAVAVYSDVDADALHVQLADEAVAIGPATPSESYLNVERLLDAAARTGCDCVHPGYGFLSENAAFAEACAAAGLKFVGPSADAMRVMGDKVASRERMTAAGVPLPPGTEGASGNPDRLVKAAAAIPFPVMVKAAGGGGGKGMRVVHEQGDLRDAIEAASREAEAAFGNATVYVEKFIESPRHIEFQVLADAQGNTVHVFERECSIQRRHQKLIEEAPSVALDDEQRTRMGETAVTVAKAVGYEGAGTVEFLLDGSGDFYFLEMNTRIQVEHAITERVTGLDLMKWQFDIAGGRKLAFEQSDIVLRGHAIECRLYAEDPANQFFPSSGTLHRWVEPNGPGIRVDSGVREGFTVTTDYDPILAKVVAYAEDREAARLRMLEALSRTHCLGVQTATGYLMDVLNHPEFIAGNLTTHFLAEHFGDWHGAEELPVEVLAAAAIAGEAPRATVTRGGEADPTPNPFQSLGAWRVGGR